jgi:hypothetical protein
MQPKKQPENSNVNTNKNTNNVSVNVNVMHPKSRTPTIQKPNWVVKAIVLGVIGLVLSFAGYYAKNHWGKYVPPPTLENNKNSKPIEGVKQN